MSTPAQLKRLLGRMPGVTLAVAESLTCGRLQALVGSVSGASAYFEGGVTAYTLAQKVKLLGVNRTQAKADGCVSQRVAEQMALGACKTFQCKLGIATTGYAEPAPKSGIYEPLAWWAVCDRRKGRPVVFSGLCELAGFDREGAQETVAAVALSALVEHLRSSRGS